MKTVAFVLLFVVSISRIDPCSSLEDERISSLEITTGVCDDCDMTMLGSLGFMICSSSFGCCFSGFKSANFLPGQVDHFKGSDLGECSQFTFRSYDDPPTVKLYHKGTDGGQFDVVSIKGSQGTIYDCHFPKQFMDDDDYLKSKGCVQK